jgi:hypothetical protein
LARCKTNLGICRQGTRPCWQNYRSGEKSISDKGVP